MPHTEKLKQNSNDLGLAVGLLMTCGAFYIGFSQPLNPYVENSRSIIEHVASVIPGTDTYKKDQAAKLENNK